MPGMTVMNDPTCSVFESRCTPFGRDVDVVVYPGSGSTPVLQSGFVSARSAVRVFLHLTRPCQERLSPLRLRRMGRFAGHSCVSHYPPHRSQLTTITPRHSDACAPVPGSVLLLEPSLLGAGGRAGADEHGVCGTATGLHGHDICTAV